MVSQVRAMSGPRSPGRSSGARPPYCQPADSRRPYGSHRFDVFSLKAGRRLTLYGRGALNLWIHLEMDPAVTNLCERPLVLQDGKPRRIVDFWARGNGADRLLLLVRDFDSEPKVRQKGADQLTAFRIWAADVGCTVEEVLASEDEGYAVDNLMILLQYCSSYQSTLTDSIIQRASQALVESMPVARLIEALGGAKGNEDADDVLRAAVYDLVRRGRAKIPQLESTRLHDGLEIAPI